jgi:signal transduction histidine kinase
MLREVPLPPVLDLAPGELMSDTVEARLVRVKGWVPFVNTTGVRLNLDLVAEPGKVLELAILNGDSPAARELSGSQVEATGVMVFRYDSSGKKVGSRVLVSDIEQIHILRTAPFAQIAGAASTPKNASLDTPVRFRANVMAHNLGEFVLVRDSSGSMRVPFPGLSYINAGTLVEVFAMPLSRGPEAVLTNVYVKKVAQDLQENEPAPVIISPARANTNLLTLTQISQIRRLSPQQASRGFPVRAIGVVTFCDLDNYMQFAQDESGGIYLDLSRINPRPGLKSGTKVELEGFSGPGDFAPILIATATRILGEAPLPQPEPVTFTKLMTGAFDSQWVSLVGMVRKQHSLTNSTILLLSNGEGLVKLIVHESPGEAGPSYEDAAVEVRGVVGSQFDEHRRLQGVEIHVPSWNSLTVKEASTTDPFLLPVKSINEFYQFHASAGELHRTHLAGAVTLCLSDGSLYVQDSTGGILVHPQKAVSLPTGTAVEIVGFPVFQDKHPVIQDAFLKPLKTGTLVESVEVKPEATMDSALHALLVRMEGKVLSSFSRLNEERLVVQFGNEVGEAVLPGDGAPGGLSMISPGSVVRISGVYEARLDDVAKVQSFQLRLRSAEDVKVISSPSWWSVRRTLWVLGASCSVLALSLSWVYSLRRQVLRRTRELRERIEQHRRTEHRLEAEILQRTRMEREVEQTHQQLLIASRQAGMAEVATSVLHNVGNVLNSVNVSASLVSDLVRQSRVTSVSRAADLLTENSGRLAEFLTQDKRGQQLPQYLGQLARHLGSEQGKILTELDLLRKNVEHIKGIVAMQQNFGKVHGVTERISPSDLMEDALRINAESLKRHNIEVLKEYDGSLPSILIDKHKTLQILVNLISNAKNACDDSGSPEKRIILRCRNGEGRLKFDVADNGVGIPHENLTRIFHHGFTTRKDGHGFGLHSGALAAKELGGSLLAHSEGPGHGSMFTLELPCAAPAHGGKAGTKS